MEIGAYIVSVPHLPNNLPGLMYSHFFFLKADGGADSVNDVANTIMHKFWDSAFALEPPEEYDNHRLSLLVIFLFLF
jgi:hypothetical protein